MANTKKYISLDKLGLYDEKIKKVITDGDAATLAAANAHAEGLATNYEPAGAITTAKNELQGKIDAVDAKADAAQAAADKAQGEVDALEALVGTLPEGTTAKDVVDYVNVKTAGIATDAALGELQGQLNGVQGDVNTIKGDYLKTADKTELANAIADEAARADAAEKANAAAIKVVVDDYLKAADKTELQGGIDAAQAAADAVQAEMNAFKLAADVGDKAVDTLKEIQDYITSDGEAAAEMAGNISANADEITAVKGRLDTAEGKITAIEGQITDIDGDIAALQGEDTAIKGRLETIEGKLGTGEGSVESKIEAAKVAAIEAAAADAATKDEALEAKIKKYVDDEDATIEASIATLQGVVDGKAAQADLTALGNRVTTAEGEIDTLQAEMDAVEAKALANEGAIGTINTELAKKAAQTDLDAATNRISALETWHSNFIECSEEDVAALFA